MFYISKTNRTGLFPYGFSISCDNLFEYTGARVWLRDTYGTTEGLSSPYYDSLRSKHWSNSVTTNGMNSCRQIYLLGDEELMMFMLRWGELCSRQEDLNS